MENVYNGDLVIVGDKKLGIFNKKTCKYITSKTYDYIELNQCGSHIIEKRKYFTKKDPETNEEYKTYDVTYNALVKDDGTIIENPDYTYLFYDGGYLLAFSKETTKKHLANCDGEIIGKGYDRIHHIAGDLFYGVDYNKKREIKTLKLLNSKGKSLPFTFTIKDNNFYLAEPNEFNSIDDFTQAIEKYGIGIIYISNKGFVSVKDFMKMVKACANYLKKSKDAKFSDAYLMIDRYKDFYRSSSIELNMRYSDIDLTSDFSDIKANRIEINYFIKNFMTQVIEPMYIYNITAIGYDWREAMYNNKLVDIFNFDDKKDKEEKKPTTKKKTTTKTVKKTETTKKSATKKATTTKKK